MLALLLGASTLHATTTHAAHARLGHAVVPTFQQVELRLDPDTTEYSGSITVDLDILESTNEVRLHSLGPTFRKMTLRDSRGVAGQWSALDENSEPGSDTPPALTVKNEEDGLLVLSAEHPLVTGPGRLVIEFVNEYDTRAEGLYKVETEGHSYLFTQFEAVDAREAFPCWDEPSFKIPYQLTITAPKGDEVISNTLPEAESAEERNRRTITFHRTPPLPSYLLAIAVGPFDSVPIEGLGVPGRVLTVRGKARLARAAVERMPPMLRALENYFGRPYPFEKLDLLAVPEFWYSGMENPGAIVFAERVLLQDPERAGAQDRRRLDAIVAHELAHMWFGDLVTMAWWNDLWLNESFATWIAEKITDQLYPEYRRKFSSFDARRSAMAMDARPNVRAIRQSVDGVNLTQIADALAYNKGREMLCMVEGWIGEEVFRTGVIAYLDRHAWSNAEAPDLWRALSEASGKDLAPVLSSFLDQPGVPIVRVERLERGRVRLTQERYRTAGSEARPAHAMWPIPVALRYPSGVPGETSVHRFLLDREELIVQLPVESTLEWIHPNADETGYYQWEVDPESMERMGAGAAEILRTPERIGFVYNLTALLERGSVSGDRYLDLLARFAGDAEPEVVTAVLDAWRAVKPAFITPELQGPFAEYVRRTLSPVQQRYGHLPRAQEPLVVSLLRPELLWWMGYEGRDESVLSLADSLAAVYLEDPARCDATLAETVLRLSAARGDEALFERYQRRFETTSDPQDRSRLLTAFGSFRRPELVERALAYALEGPLRPNERTVIARDLRTEPALQDRVFEWMMQTYEQMSALVPADRMAFAPQYAAGCSEERLERARGFFADESRQPAGTLVELTEVADRVRACVALQVREGEAAARYLRRS